ncbi:matrixin family metalloprotease [Novipirellula rosea]|uniref:Matrixin family metalloprotease n=2 Tax=Novipirellula rosea TaxID=1031540 RepID=A0ABP8MVG1_9BACT
MAEPLEARRVLAASFGWDGPGLGGAELTYTISNAPSSLSQVEVDAAIETALDAWSSVVDVTFTKVNQTGLSDSIDISFANIDGGGGTLAQAYFPDDVNPARIAGDIQFDTSEIWEVGNSLGNQAFDLVWVAAHEIGHSLGLDHLADLGSVLQPSVSPNQQFTGLDSSDVAEALMLYAPSTVTETSDDPVVDTPIDDTPVDERTNEDPSSTDDTDTTDADIPEAAPDDTPDSEDDPFPRRRWRRGGNWHRWGGRLEADVPENHNLYAPTDANNDGSTSALDALVIINQLSRNNDLVSGFSDVNGDGSVTALDALLVINSLVPAETEGTSESIVGADVVAEQGDSLQDSVENEESVENEDSLDIEDEFENQDDIDLTNNTPSVGSDDDTDVVTDDDSSDADDSLADDDSAIDDGGLTDQDGEDDDDSAICDHERFSPLGRPHHRFERQPPFRVGFDQLLARYDANEDGSLSEEELPETVWSRLSDDDVDADGLISSDEFAAWLDTRETKITIPSAESTLTTMSPPTSFRTTTSAANFDSLFAQLGRRDGRGRR